MAAEPAQQATQNAPSRFESTFILDGGKRQRVNRRRASLLITRLPAYLRRAVDTYSATAEAVLASGVATGGLSDRVSGGPAIKEGRQFHAVRLVQFLRLMERAVGADWIILNKRNGQGVTVLELWRRPTLSDLTMKAFLKAKGFGNRHDRRVFCKNQFIQAAQRVADAIDKNKSPWSA